MASPEEATHTNDPDCLRFDSADEAVSYLATEYVKNLSAERDRLREHAQRLATALANVRQFLPQIVMGDDDAFPKLDAYQRADDALTAHRHLTAGGVVTDGD